MYIGCVQYVVPEKNVGGSDLHVIQSHLLSSRQQAVLTLNNFCYVHMFARGGKIVFVKVFIYFPQKVETDSHPISSGNDGCMYVEHIAVLLGQQNTHLSDRLYVAETQHHSQKISKRRTCLMILKSHTFTMNDQKAS